MAIKVRITNRDYLYPEVEFVERKGIGHPDTICDTLAERLAKDLVLYYCEKYGDFRHFNVDKALLSAGQVEVGFGGGEVKKPTTITLAGKVDAREGWPPLGKLLRNAYWELGRILPKARLPGDYSIVLSINPSSDDLLPLLEKGTSLDEVPLANDTSFAIAHWPRTPLEEAVLKVEQLLSNRVFRAATPIGTDIKVMGYQQGNAVRLTISVAVLAEKVPNQVFYDGIMDTVHDKAKEVVREVFRSYVSPIGTLEVFVNRADQPPENFFLTVTGSSAEAGDDGQVGRGNRMGGLITPHRAMSLEAIAGKNPVGHVGKLYHAIAWDAAQEIARLDDIYGASVYLLSEIGRPITEPVAVQVEVLGKVDDHNRQRIDRIIDNQLGLWYSKVKGLVGGKYPLF